MKQLFIGLLIVAAAAGVYYFLQNKKTPTTETIDRELLPGKWKIDSLYVSPKDSANPVAVLLLKDSSFRKQVCDFRENGTVLLTVSNSAKIDTSYYEWNRKNELLIKELPKDSIGEAFSVNRLSSDSLVLESKGSATFILTKLK